jgi:simple sugar transport system ATP-binding protein
MLILDEPTNHLSVKETNKVLEFVVQLREQGVSSIFISHNLHHVYPISDRIVVMARGEKIADVERTQTSVDDLTRMIV